MNEESILVVHEVVENIRLQLSEITQQTNSLNSLSLSHTLSLLPRVNMKIIKSFLV